MNHKNTQNVSYQSPYLIDFENKVDYTTQLGAVRLQELLEAEMQAWNDGTDLGLPMVIDRPFSATSGRILRASESDKNPYHFICSKYPQITKKLENLPQYGLKFIQLGQDYYSIQNHNRFLHSIDVAGMMERVTALNGFVTKDIHKAIIAGLTHDLDTPPLGDPTKMQFPQLSEEELYGTFMRSLEGFETDLERARGVGIDELKPIVKNEGPLGRLLDITDRCAYTLRDALPRMQSKKINKDDVGAKHKIRINELLKQYPTIGDVTDSLRLIDNQRVITEPEAFLALLEIRAHMHHLVYMNPINRCREIYIGLALKYCLECEVLKMEDFATGIHHTTGQQIDESFLDRLAQIGFLPQSPNVVDQFFTYETTTSADLALKTVNKNLKCGQLTFVKPIPPFKGGVGYLVQKGNEIGTIEKLYPEEANILKDLGKGTAKFLLCTPTSGSPSFKEFDSFLIHEFRSQYNDLDSVLKNTVEVRKTKHNILNSDEIIL